jgi:hypothetical protein
MSDDLERLWKDHKAALQRHRELIAKLPATPEDYLSASPEQQMEWDIADDLEKVQAKITETWEAIRKFRVS